MKNPSIMLSTSIYKPRLQGKY